MTNRSETGKAVTVTTGRALPVTAFLAGALLVLDLLGKISVSWWVISAVWLAPVLLLIAVGAVVVVVGGVGLAIFAVFEEVGIRRKRKRAAQQRLERRNLRVPR